MCEKTSPAIRSVELVLKLPPVGLHKKVVIKVRAKRHVRQKRYNNGFVRLERIFSYDVKKAENRLKEKFGDPNQVKNPPNNDPPEEDGGGDNNGGDTYDEEEIMELDPNAKVWICHRRVRKGKITWRTKSIRQKFMSKHIGHGDKNGKC